MTQPSAGKWGDLAARIGSAAAMVAVGLFCIWHGGTAFRLLVGFVTGVMFWELVRMLVPARSAAALALAALSALSVVLIPEVGLWFALALGLAPVVAMGFAAPQRLRMGVPYAAVVILGASALVFVRDTLGFGWLMWIVVLVIATDVAGYFAGKTFGGPKFWPSISPKKTWSGTVAGWGGAALVGYVFALGSGMIGAVVAASLVLSFAGQMGDIWESAIKRRTGVKDSSTLIPGHGGVLDRFDALMGAAAVLILMALLTGFPPGLFGW
jgi:phosphatidate cytidylyltransferase